MKNNLLICCCFFLLPTFSFSQTLEQNLESAIVMYNALAEYMRPLSKPADITPEVLQSIQKRVNDGTALLNKVIDNGTAEQIKTARYFKVNFRYKLGFTYGIKGETQKAYNEMKAISDEFERYTDANMFPLRYKFVDLTKNYIVNHTNFLPTLSEYYTSMAELLTALSKYEEVLVYAKKTINSPHSTNWLKYIAYDKSIVALTKLGRFDEELAGYAVQTMKLYTNDLGEAEHKTIADNKYPSPLSNARTLEKVLNTKPNLAQKSTLCADAAKIYSTVANRDENLLLRFYDIAIADNKSVNEALSYVKTQLKTNPAAKDKLMKLGLAALEKKANGYNSSTDCVILKEISDDYALFGNTAKSQEWRVKNEKCLADKKKAEEEAERQRRRNNRDGHFYLGANMFPLFFGDFGGVVNFGSKNSLVEFSYLKVTNKKENTFDLDLREIHDVPTHRWNGYFTHIAYKKGHNSSFGKSSGSTYTGILLAYNHRNFDEKTVSVLDKTTNRSSNQTFNPTTNQYVLMLNLGMMYLRQVGIDAFFGLGAAYNKFDGGNGTVWNNDKYQIDDALIANRKPSYFSFTMRMGVTVGFGW
ncbi:MAG: hypothetical protein JNL70_22375 [Saprospiraceae bacterium]|nr:hypothetical protein [Saprospiraceae bacterium]